MERLINLSEYPVKPVLQLLLEDKTTKKNIVFATNSYAHLGSRYEERCAIDADLLLGMDAMQLQPRVLKDASDQASRTREKAEVMTPSWIVNKMNNHCDEEWFGYPDVFNKEQGGQWTANKAPVRFPEGRTWQQYVNSSRMEITCGEAPYLVSRYDAATGEPIPVANRIGLLDRKLRVIGENTSTRAEWMKWVIKAYQSCYGYEYQGDSLLIGRINLLVTFADHMAARWNEQPAESQLQELAQIIAWNLWQMDGITGKVPYTDQFAEYENRTGKCEFVVGNPPYQEERKGKSNTALPIYHKFMSAAFELGDAAELITPARFLFNAGRTPKDWNRARLADEHFKVLYFEKDAAKIFPDTEIKGGVAVTYRNAGKTFQPIGVFTPDPLVNRILAKAGAANKKDSIASICYVASKFHMDHLENAYPQYAGHERRMSSNVLSFPCFHPLPESEEDLMIYGNVNAKRTGMYINRRFVDVSDFNLPKYKIVVPKADGNGTFGDTITLPEILPPNSGFTHTFLGIGGFDTREEAEAALKYIKTRMARALLGVLKVTQDVNADKWTLVPLQDFTSASDIDWSEPVAQIDRQLYKKYGLSDEEADFIEAHVKEMN